VAYKSENMHAICSIYYSAYNILTLQY